MGWLIDRFWAPVVALPMFAEPAIFCRPLAQDHLSVDQAVVAVALFGASVGSEADLIIYVATRYFRLRHYAEIHGVLFGLFISLSRITSLHIGRIPDLAGSYREFFLIRDAVPGRLLASDAHPLSSPTRF